MVERRHRPLVTVAALYGAGGSVVAQRVADRLGVELLDRGIPQAVATEIGLSERAVTNVGDDPRSRLGRWAGNIGRLSTLTGEGGGAMERLDVQERAVRAHVEGFMARSVSIGGVVLGRGGMVVLRSVPWALHVQLAGALDRRVRQAAESLGIDAATAARNCKQTDRARIDYVSRVYGVDGNDPSLYHVVLDSTALSLDACVELIVAAANARIDDPEETTSG